VSHTVPCVGCDAPLRQSRPYFRSAKIVLYECKSCGSLTSLPRPTPAEQIGRHDTEAYFEHPYFECRRGANAALERRCRLTFEEIGNALDARKLRGARHLDVGCDTGAFLLAAARLYGTVPYGVDIARRSVAEASKRGVTAYCCPLEELPGGVSGFTLLTAIDVLEHVSDPSGFMVEVNRRLEPGGVCYIETPNARSRMYRWARVLGQITGNFPRWAFDRLFPPEHIQYFSEAGLRAIVRKAGLEVVRVSSRRLGWPDIAATIPVRAAVSAIQMFDQSLQERLLLCMVARRPNIGKEMGG